MTTCVKAAASPFRELFTLYDVRSADDTFMEAWNPANIAIAKQCTYLHPQRIATKADRRKLLRELHETEQGLQDLSNQTGKSYLRIRIKYALKSYYQDAQRTDCANQPSKQAIEQWSWQQLFCSFFVFLVEKGDHGLDAKRLKLLWRWASDLRQHWAQQNYGGDRFINDHTRPDTNARAAVILGVAIYNEWACKLMDTVPRPNPSQPLFFVEDVDQVPPMSDRIMSLETCAAADIVYIMKEHLHKYLDDVNVQNHKEKILECIATNDMNGAKLKNMNVKTFAQMIIKHCGDKKLHSQLRKIHKELVKFDFTMDDEKKDVEPVTTERLQEVFERERVAAASSKSTLTQSKTAMTTTSAMSCSPQQCGHLDRVIRLLHFHQQLLDLHNYDVMLPYVIEADGYLLNDWNHILSAHLGDKRTNVETRRQYGLIYGQLQQFKSFKQCDFKTCAAFKRNRRERETEKAALIKDEKLAPFVDLLDSIHCRLLHSFESGLRQHASEIALTEEKNDADANSAAPPYSRFVSVVTVVNATVANVNDDNNPPPYSFGCLSAFDELKPKYDDFKEELLHNKICPLSLDEYKIQLSKAETEKETDQAKHTIHKDDRNRPGTTMHMDDEKDAEKKVKKPAVRTRKTLRSCNAKVQRKTTDIRVITVDHLLAVVIYCALTNLQYEFSKTFRMIEGDKNEDDVKKRNHEFGHWTRLLREVVNDYGDAIESCAAKTLYHGISTRMVFPSFKVKFDCPTSLTVRKDVAARFASNGIVLELKMDSSDLMFFNCTWLSCFPNEDERLVLSTPTIKLHDIVVMSTNTSYKVQVHALTWFNHCIQGCKPPGDVKSAKPKDARFMAFLLNQSRDQIAGQGFEYLWRLFDYIAVNVKSVDIVMAYMDQFYGVFSPLLFTNGVFRFADMCKMFPNCKRIGVKYRNNEMDFVAKRDEFLKEFEKTVKHVEYLQVKFNAKPAASEVKQLRSHQHVQKSWQKAQGDITLIVVREKMTWEERELKRKNKKENN